MTTNDRFRFVSSENVTRLSLLVGTPPREGGDLEFKRSSGVRTPTLLTAGYRLKNTHKYIRGQRITEGRVAVIR